MTHAHRARWFLRLMACLLACIGTAGVAHAQTPDQALFGPKQYLRTSGPPNQYTDTLTLPAGATAPFLLHIVNGNADGTNRVSSATVTLNGSQIAGPSDFNQNVAVIDRAVTLQANNTLEVRLTSAPGSFLTISVLATSVGPQPTALTPNPLNLTAGTTGTLMATIAPSPTAVGSLTVSSSDTSVATVPATVSFAVGQMTIPIQLTAVAVGTATTTVSLNGGSAASQVTVVPPPPTITSVTPATGRVGDPVTITGTNFVNVQSVTFSGLASVFTVTTVTTLVATVPTGATTGTVAVTTAGGTATSPQPFTVLSPPALAPIGNQTVALGSTLTFTVTATDPNNDPVSFAVTPLPLPAHATFHTETGLFTFTPDATQVGTTTLTFLASDGLLSSSETITITVTGAPAGGITGLTGRVEDTSRHPLDNLTVSLKGTALSTVTAADGTFTLTSATMPAGRQQLVVTGLPQNFANLVAPVDIIANVSNQLVQPLTLPPLDTATAVTVNPTATTVLTSSTLNVTVTIPPNTAKNPDGTPFTGQLTISPVPEYGRPESRPVELKPGLSVTIQPAGIVMTPPVPITFPNLDNMAPGNELDLWSLSPDTGTFYVAGRMRVSADGQRLETISGGVQKTAWHFPMGPSPTPDAPDHPDKDGDCTECQVNSGADLTAGALTQDLVVPGVRTLGLTRDLTLHYRSTNADVQRILPINAALSVLAAVPQTFSARLTLGGVQQGPELYWNSQGLPENSDSLSRLGLQFDGSALPTGQYPYELMLFSNYPQSSIGGATQRALLLRNERASAFGAGWTVRGVDRLWPQSTGRLVLAEGSGATSLFTPGTPTGGVTPYQGPPGDFSTLVKNADGTYTRTMKDGTKQQFNAQGLQTSITDRNNNTTIYTYDGQGRLTTITDPVGQVTAFGYTGGLLSSITDPTGRVTRIQHDGAGNLIRVTDHASHVTAFVYDPQHRLIQRTDARNKVYHYQYDYTGRFSQVTLPTGETRKLSPSQRIAVPNVAAGEGTQANPAPLAAPVNAASFTDARNHTTTFELDALGRVTKQTDALTRTTTIVRDAQGNPTQITRPTGAITTMTYDAKGNLLTSTEQAIAATTTFTYEPTFNQVTRITDPKGNQTNITYDAQGNPLTITDADNKVTTFTYNAQGLLLTTKDALNQTTTFTYDTLGRLLTTTDPLNRTTTLTYDTAGNVATSTDTLTRVTTFTYDSFNRLTTVTDPASGVTTYTYDGNGNLLSVKDAKNQTTSFTYDDLNRLAGTTDPLGKTESYAYDGADNLLSRVTPKHDTISFAYDAVNQLRSKTLPGSLVTSYTYDAVGNLLTVTDPDSQLTMTYDLANRLLTTSTAGSPNQPAVTLTSTYDKNGNRLTLHDQTATTLYRYDVLNRLTTLSAPGTLACPVPTTTGLISYWPGEGTANDLQDGHHGTLHNGATFAPGIMGQAFAFDGNNDYVEVPHNTTLLPPTVTLDFWLNPRSYPGETVSAIPLTKGSYIGPYWIEFYNNLVAAWVRSGGSNYHVVGAQPPLDTWTHYTFTFDGTTWTAYTNGAVTDSRPVTGTVDPTITAPLSLGRGGWNATFGSVWFDGRLDEIRIYDRALSSGEVAALECRDTTTFAYDALSRRTSVALPNGTQTTYSYDPASQVTQILHQLTATSTQINQAAYAYNPVGNRTSLTDRRGAQAFGYDNLDRLTSATHPLPPTSQTFAYDPVGNRTTGGSVVNAGNQLTEDATFTYQYDDNGNQTRKTNKTTNNFTVYTYDAENRLTKVEDFLAGNPTPTATSTYRYDGLGRRIEKVTPTGTRRYIYDGEDILLEYDGANVLQARYTHGPGIDEPIAVTKGGSTFFYHQDGLGTVTELTDSTGSTAKSYAYDAYGTIVEQTGTLDQPYTYTGREFDSESGLYYYRARYYDSVIGRFFQKDKIGVRGGQHDYSYANSNPVRFKDPFGLAPEPCPDCQRKCQAEYDSCVAVVGLQGSACSLTCMRIAFVTKSPQLTAICLTACGGRAAIDYAICRSDRNTCLQGCQ